MARQIKERIDQTNAFVREQAPVNLGVAAAPTGPRGAPRPYDPALDIADALKSLNPALNKFTALAAQDAAKKDKDEADAQIAKGAMDRFRQSDDAPVAMTKEQNPYWQQGYMRQHGSMLGDRLERDLNAAYDAHKDEEDFGVDKLINEFKGQHLAGLDDKDVIAGMLPKLSAAEQKLRDHHSKVGTEEVREQQVAKVTESANHLVSKFSKMNLGEQRNAYLRFRDESRLFSGRLWKESAAIFAESMHANAATLRPEDWDIFNEKFDDQVLGTVRTGNGTPLSEVAARGKALSIKAQEERIKDRLHAQNQETMLSIEERLNNDPMSVGDPSELTRILMGPTGPLTAPGAPQAFYDKVFTAQKKWADTNGRMESLIRLGRFAPRAIIDDPEVKKRLDADGLKLWDATDLNDRKAVGSTVQKLIRQYEEIGHLDSRLEGILKNFHTGDFARGPDGKQTTDITREFKLAADVYHAVSESTNPQLLSTLSDDNRAILGYFNTLTHERGMREADAFQVAKNLGSDKARERAKLFLPKGDDLAKRVDRAGEKAESFWRGNGTGYFEFLRNKKEFGMEVHRNAEIKIRLGMPTDDAYDQAYTEEIARHQSDGNGYLVKLPPGTDKNVVRDTLPQLIEDAKIAFKDSGQGKLENYHVIAKREGGTVRFHVQDLLFNDVLPSRTIEEMKEIRNVVQRADPQSITDAQDITAKINNSTITPGEVYQQWEYIRSLRDKGRISGRSMTVLEHVYDQERRRVNNEKFDKMINGQSVFNPPSPEQVLKEDTKIALPVTNPTGNNLSTAQYAVKFADTNPQFALTALAEGMRFDRHPDPAKGENIGLGYSITSREPDVVMADFKAIGITGARAARVFHGEEQITPDEAIRLFERTKGQYEQIAIKHFGEDAWKSFKPNVKAVLTDIAYCNGKSLFPKLVKAMHEGRFDEAAKEVAIYYKDRKTGEMKYNERRVNLWRAMLAGTEVFRQLAQRGI